MDEKTDIYRNFFLALAERKNNENDLSDITYALLKTSKEFEIFFLKFLFPDDYLEDEQTGEWKREFSNGNARPDFLYTTSNNNYYIVENKINDQNTHNVKYRKMFPDEKGYKRAFIANYHPNKEDVSFYKNCTTWFALYRQRNSIRSKNKIEQDLINAYFCYLENILDFNEVNEVDLSNVSSLISFRKLLKEVADDNGYNTSGGKYRDCNEQYYGHFFYKESLWIWFGIYFSEEEDDGIYIGVLTKDKSWCPKKIKNKIENMKDEGDTYKKQTLEKPDGNFGDTFFRLRQKKYFDKYFKGKVTVDEQRNVLNKFFTEVMGQILEES